MSTNSVVPPNRLTELREARGLRITDVAAAIGVVERTVFRYETGESQIPDRRKFELAEFFEVSVPYLTGWTDTKAAA